jgi:hypothetical protein
LTSADLAGFAQLDQKFAYIADAGLVHANAMISWAAQPHDFPAVMTPAYMASVARYWDARYGAYPVIWTVAQEIDNDFYGVYSGTAMAPWTAAIEALDAADAYGQPLMPHQETSTETSVGNSRFAAEPWHDGFAAQLQFTDGWNLGTASAYWNSGKPSLAYETPYEDFWTDSRHALSALYKSYLLGFRGYGYGVSGLWNDVYSAPGEPLDAGTDYELPARYQWWFTGANRQTANQLTYGVGFFRGLDWWKLTPRFGDQLWSDFGSGDNFVASDNNKLYVALFTSAGSGTGTLRQLDPDHYYSAEWFNPRTGQRTTIATGFKATSGRWTAPQRPTAEDWVLSVKMGAPFRNDPDLTVGGSYSASSSWDANQTAVNAFDGKFTTNWQACNGCWAQQWLAVDFQQNKTFNEVAVSEYGNRTTGYRIEYWNGTSWQTAYTGTGGFGQMGETTSVHFPAVTGSKARILYLSGTANAPIVYELSVFNRAGT